MSSLVERVKSKLLNPIAIYHFLDAATKSITIDSQLGGIHGLYDLAMSVRNLPASQVTFFTLPTYPRQLVVPTDTANVLWTQPVDSRIFQDFRNDIPVSSARSSRPGSPRCRRTRSRCRSATGPRSSGCRTRSAACCSRKAST